MTLAVPLNEPLAGGSIEAPGQTYGVWPVVLDGRGFMVDTDEDAGAFIQRGVDVVRQRTSNRGETAPLLTPPEVWRHLIEDWSMGAGQEDADRQDSLTARFFSSKGIDPWERWSIRLLPDTESLQATGGTPLLCPVDGRLGVFIGSNVYIYTDLDTSSSHALGAAALSVSSTGSGWVVACDDGTVKSVTSAGSVSTLATLANVSVVAYAKGRIIAAANHVLSDVTSGTPSTIFTHPLTSYRWRSIVDGLSYIFVLGGIGDRWQVSRIGISDDATALLPPVVSAPLPEGEVGWALGCYLDFLLVGTDSGVRFGQVSNSGEVALGAAIPTTEPVLCFEGQGRFVWYGLSDYDDTSTGLGRLDLTQFTSGLTPAYASDLMADGDGDVTSVVTYLGKRVFAVAGSGVFMESDTKVAEGSIHLGDLSFDTTDEKSGHYVSLKHDPLDGQVAVSAHYDDSTLAPLGVSAIEGSTSSENMTMGGVLFRRLGLSATLTRGDGDGPVITSIEVRATGVLGRHTEWEIPLLIADTVDLYGQEVPRNPSDDVEHLLSLLTGGAQFRAVINDRGYTAYAHQYRMLNRELSAKSNAYQGTFTIIIREMR